MEKKKLQEQIIGSLKENYRKKKKKRKENWMRIMFFFPGTET